MGGRSWPLLIVIANAHLLSGLLALRLVEDVEEPPQALRASAGRSEAFAEEDADVVLPDGPLREEERAAAPRLPLSLLQFSEKLGSRGRTSKHARRSSGRRHGNAGKGQADKRRHRDARHTGGGKGHGSRKTEGRRTLLERQGAEDGDYGEAAYGRSGATSEEPRLQQQQQQQPLQQQAQPPARRTALSFGAVEYGTMAGSGGLEPLAGAGAAASAQEVSQLQALMAMQGGGLPAMVATATATPPCLLQPAAGGASEAERAAEALMAMQGAFGLLPPVAGMSGGVGLPPAPAPPPCLFQASGASAAAASAAANRATGEAAVAEGTPAAAGQQPLVYGADYGMPGLQLAAAGVVDPTPWQALMQGAVGGLQLPPAVASLLQPAAPPPAAPAPVPEPAPTPPTKAPCACAADDPDEPALPPMPAPRPMPAFAATEAERAAEASLELARHEAEKLKNDVSIAKAQALAEDQAEKAAHQALSKAQEAVDLTKEAGEAAAVAQGAKVNAGDVAKAAAVEAERAQEAEAKEAQHEASLREAEAEKEQEDEEEEMREEKAKKEQEKQAREQKAREDQAAAERATERAQRKKALHLKFKVDRETDNEKEDADEEKEHSMIQQFEEEEDRRRVAEKAKQKATKQRLEKAQQQAKAAVANELAARQAQEETLEKQEKAQKEAAELAQSAISAQAAAVAASGSAGIPCSQPPSPCSGGNLLEIPNASFGAPGLLYPGAAAAGGLPVGGFVPGAQLLPPSFPFGQAAAAMPPGSMMDVSPWQGGNASMMAAVAPAAQAMNPTLAMLSAGQAPGATPASAEAGQAAGFSADAALLDGAMGQAAGITSGGESESSGGSAEEEESSGANAQEGGGAEQGSSTADKEAAEASGEGGGADTTGAAASTDEDVAGSHAGGGGDGAGGGGGAATVAAAADKGNARADAAGAPASAAQDSTGTAEAKTSRGGDKDASGGAAPQALQVLAQSGIPMASLVQLTPEELSQIQSLPPSQLERLQQALDMKGQS
eukprot:TRINITY_DN7709_c0_g1_i7.p1 TRINITY_DN7709_c0_g1~~TRINITY_DN7709_c0_g1_i7.p1  ORF type:complete len:1010 (+),score=376.40 TRINITY_DN7709_c0_g1_i7:117-3146(+)